MSLKTNEEHEPRVQRSELDGVSYPAPPSVLLVILLPYTISLNRHRVKSLYGLLYLNFGIGTIIALILQMSNLRLRQVHNLSYS